MFLSFKMLLVELVLIKIDITYVTRIELLSVDTASVLMTRLLKKNYTFI